MVLNIFKPHTKTQYCKTIIPKIIMISQLLILSSKSQLEYSTRILQINVLSIPIRQKIDQVCTKKICKHLALLLLVQALVLPNTQNYLQQTKINKIKVNLEIIFQNYKIVVCMCWKDRQDMGGNMEQEGQQMGNDIKVMILIEQVLLFGMYWTQEENLNEMLLNIFGNINDCNKWMLNNYISKILKGILWNMSQHFFEQPKYYELNLPSIPHFNSTLLLIQTKREIQAFPSISCLQKSLYQANNEEEFASIEAIINSRPQTKRKKTGCTCKKTNCLKMYCECFSSGKKCTSECSCCDCYNIQEYQEAVTQIKAITKMKTKHAGCHCKKTQCQKKYCQCYCLGVSCTQLCKCSDCCNQDIKKEQSDHLSELYQ